jgi:HSP20 family molecular chaperone IbpA
MSPFSQLSSPSTGYGGGIDRDFSPILNYLDEFDRHFSRRHRFVNCFIPRFDLEEDENNYYLYGDIPGAGVADINIEAHDNHTLVIWGKTQRAGPEVEEGGQAGEESTESRFVKVPVQDHEQNGTGPQEKSQGAEVERTEDDAKNSKTEAVTSAAGTNPSSAQAESANPQSSDEKPYYPPPPAEPTPSQPHAHSTSPHHQRRPTIAQKLLSNPSPFSPTSYTPVSGHHVLLSERLVGDFHRTFAFPSAVNEEGVKASVVRFPLSLSTSP